MAPERARPVGTFVTIEGVEGAGKSTQLARLRASLEAAGHSVLTTSEPDGTPLGRSIRALLGGLAPLDPVAETLLFAASRAEHVRRVIAPALDAGQIVLCDRFADSTVAYQGYGRGVALDTIAAVNRLASEGRRPDLTLILDLDVAEGLRRARTRRPPAAGTAPNPLEADPFERLALEFHERVRKGYWAIQAREPERVVLIDASRDEAAVAAEIQTLLATRLARGRTR
jgi:dTMP kinase